MARNSKKSSTKISVDLTKTEDGRKALPEGTYNVTVDSATIENSQSGNQYIKMTFEVAEGKYSGSKLFHNCSLQPQALFNLKAVLTALGFSIPKKAFDLDIKELIGLECQVEVATEVYEGKKKAVIVEFINPEDAEETESDEDDEIDVEEILGDLSLKELKAVAKALGMKVGKKDEEGDIIEKVMEEEEDDIVDTLKELGHIEDDEDEDDSDGDEDEEEEDDEDEDDTDYEDMTEKELKALCKERGLKVTKKMDKADIIEMLEEDDEE